MKVPPAQAVLCALLLLSACKVELTPAEFFDHRGAAQDQGETAAAEVRDRVIAMAQALSRGSSRDALSALAPSADAYIFATQGDIRGDPLEQAQAQLESLAGKVQPLNPEAVVLRQAAAANVVWFRTRLLPSGDGVQEVRVTGVYVRHEGVWNLVQAHFSTAPSAEGATADSQVPEAYPAPAGAPAEGE